jgi:hypothetical protein
MVKNIVLLSAVAGLTAFYFLNDPAGKPVGMPCLIQTYTGWKCWGCGGQRAFHQILHGNIQEAFRLNALIFPVLMLFGYIIVSELSHRSKPYYFLQKRSVQISTLLLVIGFTILRNVSDS